MNSRPTSSNTEPRPRDSALELLRASRSSFHTPHPALCIPELLSPAGDWDCVRAAVENGADAIYFGLEKFNARMRAHNFTEADLPKLLEHVHARGVKAYVTFNTLVFENEMAEAEQFVHTMIAAGVDAAIVQDVGICRLIRQFSADFPIHVSTQMTITSAGGVDFARELGCNLVVLARECSLKEIEKIQAAQFESAQGSTTHKALPLEVFVHGALCVAYSGQCLTSEALGGRSANRGECAQACRMPYDLLADGQPVPLGDRKYLLSPQDLAGLEILPDLVRLGVASLKIEGRLKAPEYVANITRIYRNALDQLNPPSVPAALGQQPISRKTPGVQPPLPTPHTSHLVPDFSPHSPRYEMEMSFSRGLYTGWFGGVNNQALVHGRFGKKRGVYLGEVLQVRSNGVILHLEGPLKPGDGIVFDAGRPDEAEEGGRVHEIKPGFAPGLSLDSPWTGRAADRLPVGCAPGKRRTAILLRFGDGDIDFSRVQVGNKVWKTSDPALERHLRQSFEGEKPRFRRPIKLEVHGLVATPLSLIARDELGHVVRLTSSVPLVQAETQPLTTARLREQLGRLGGTPFKLDELKNCLEGEVLLPISELNRLRRDAVAQLQTLRAQPKRWTFEPGAESGTAPLTVRHSSFVIRPKPRLGVLVRNLSQLDAALRCGIETLYCDFEDPKKYRDAVNQFRSSSCRTAHSALFVAPPRVFKMGEEWTLKQVRACEADGYLVRNYDHLRFFAQDRRVGDYSFNIANRLAADYFKNKFGLERVTASYDLNIHQLEALLQAVPPEWLEIAIHQHMPMFHMEHCLFCAFLSQGTDYTNCGRPCDHHDLKLRDRVGAEHPVKADVGCRNTVFNALAQTGAEHVSGMIALGARHFRIEFLNETPAQVTQTIAQYRQLLNGEVNAEQLWRQLKLLSQLGVTRGQLGVANRPIPKPIL